MSSGGVRGQIVNKQEGHMAVSATEINKERAGDRDGSESGCCLYRAAGKGLWDKEGEGVCVCVTY